MVKWSLWKLKNQSHECPFEFYAALLTDKQMNYIELYYADDYSLAEIAEEFGVSRQAVYDNIKRTGEDFRGLRDEITYVFRLHRP